MTKAGEQTDTIAGGLKSPPGVFQGLAEWSALGLLALLAAWPVLHSAHSVPTAGDGLNHFYRLVELDWAIRHGLFYPRWMPDLGYGYGMPLFVYYPPLAYYMAEAFHLAGLSFASSITAGFALALISSATGAYVWAREVFDRAAALVAAAAYAFAPYLYVNVLARGALPEALALGMLPWLFWAYRRFVLAPDRRTFVIAVLLHAAFILTHTLSALVVTPLIALYATLEAARRRPLEDAERRLEIGGFEAPRWGWRLVIGHWSLVIVSLLIPFLLSAFFWLPAVLETGYVRSSQLFIPALDFHNHFVTPAGLLAWPGPFDPKLVAFDFPPSLGWPQTGLAIVGLVSAAITRRGEQRAHVLGAWLVLALLVFLIHPASVHIWETTRLLRYLQFPWRLVGPTSLMLALGAGGGAAYIAQSLKDRSPLLASGKWRLETAERPDGVGDWVLTLAPLSFWIFSLPWTFTAGYERLADPTVADIARYERESGHLGTTSAGEYLPVGVAELPDPVSLAGRYTEELIIKRLDREALPDGATVIEESVGLDRATATIDAPSSFGAIFEWFYFPGWQATVNGEPSQIAATTPQGLIAVDVPPGKHTIAISFGATPLRQAADAISLATLVGLTVGAIAWRPIRSLRSRSWLRWPALGKIECFHMTGFFQEKIVPAGLEGFYPSLLFVSLFLIRLVYLDRAPNLFSRTRFDGANVSGVGIPLAVNFDNRLELIGLDLPNAVVPAGGEVDFVLYWRPLTAPLDADYSIAAHLLDENGFLFGQADSQHPNGVPTSRWRADQYALDRHRLRLLPGTPPGAYRLVVGVYRFDTGASLSVRDENDIPQGTTIAIAEINVTRPERFASDAELAPSVMAGQQVGPLTLVGYDLDEAQVYAGSPLYFTLYWRARDVPPERLSMRTELVADDGAVVLADEMPPARADYPTTEWAAGEAVRAPHRLRLPADAPAGNVGLRVSLVNGAGVPVGGPLELDRIGIVAPDRSTERPEIAHPLEVIFGGAIRLLGYDLLPESLGAGQPFQLTLYWESLAPVSQSYTVFIHLLDGENRIWAQRDGMPMGGARPTTGWLPGEILTDVYELSVEPEAPAGEYVIEVGLYDAASGVRLPIVDEAGQAGEDRALLASVRVAR